MSHTKLVTVAALVLLACNKDRPNDAAAPVATAAVTGTPTAPAASPPAAAAPTPPVAAAVNTATPAAATPAAAATVAVQGKPAGPVIEAGCSFDGRQLKGNDGDLFHFMDTGTYEQVHISAEALGDSKDYLIPEMLIRVEFYDVEPVGIELPPTVDLVVKQTVPGIKGATASNQIKPATLETGLVIQVPPFVNEGDKVRVNTETGEYQSRA